MMVRSGVSIRFDSFESDKDKHHAERTISLFATVKFMQPLLNYSESRTREIPGTASLAFAMNSSHSQTWVAAPSSLKANFDGLNSVSRLKMECQGDYERRDLAVA